MLALKISQHNLKKVAQFGTSMASAQGYLVADQTGSCLCLSRSDIQVNQHSIAVVSRLKFRF